jgi:ribosomal protein S18 acetylase RimI-like enzyme
MTSSESVTIQALEHALFRAWPSLSSCYYDGWLLRFAEGYTRRANSVNPVDGSTEDTAHKIAVCEQRYQQRGLLPHFRLTRTSQPDDLEAHLTARGYQRSSDTFMQTLALEGRSFASLETAHDEFNLTRGWLTACADINQIADDDAAVMQRMLLNIHTPVCYTRTGDPETPDAVGMAVADGEFVGLFKLAVHPGKRRAGIGQALTEHLLAWGMEQGATTAYLQVISENAPAQALYEKLGFAEQYRYWYFSLPDA